MLTTKYEREPSTQTYTTAYRSFNQDLTGTRTDPKGGGRVDFQFSSQTRLMVCGNISRLFTPFDPRYTGGAPFEPLAALPSSVSARWAHPWPLACQRKYRHMLALFVGDFRCAPGNLRCAGGEFRARVLSCL